MNKLLLSCAVTTVVFVSTLAQAGEPSLKLPLGLDARSAQIPEGNAQSPDKIALGKMFFWDTRWSSSGTVSCVSCHPPDHGWADPQPRSTNFAGKPTLRHAPTIVNRLFSDRQLWTGLRGSLEDQAGNDSNRTDETIAKHLGEIPEYQREFQKVFGRPLDGVGVAQAIAAYVRTINSGGAPYDRFRAGDKRAMSAAAQRGLALFNGKAGCARCHSGFNFSDERYYNIGVGMAQPDPDLGRFLVTKDDRDKGAFKTPTLRDAAQRGPYMHDGSVMTLVDVVAYYDRGGTPNQWLSSKIKPLGLTADERADLVELLKALSGRIDPEVSRPPRLPK